MTNTAAKPASPTTDTWADQIEQLRTRYKHVRQPILVALNILLQDPGITLDDAKAQASLHGVRITAASVSAAQRLLSRRDDRPAAGSDTSKGTAKAPSGKRLAKAPVDMEQFVRLTVAQISAKGAAEADRLRAAMRKAMEVLASAVDA